MPIKDKEEYRTYQRKYQQRDSQKQKAYRYRHLSEVRERDRWRKIKEKYGVTREQWEAKYQEQGGCCAGCFIAFGTKRFNKPCVDHDHKTGEFRGLLCHACNRAIGLLQESISTLQELASYLQKFK